MIVAGVVLGTFAALGAERSHAAYGRRDAAHRPVALRHHDNAAHRNGVVRKFRPSTPRQPRRPHDRPTSGLTLARAFFASIVCFTFVGAVLFAFVAPRFSAAFRRCRN
jgi:hypothetical protein